MTRMQGGHRIDEWRSLSNRGLADWSGHHSSAHGTASGAARDKKRLCCAKGWQLALHSIDRRNRVAHVQVSVKAVFQ